MTIRKIIKRDGTIEDFDPSKPNGWGEWASKNLGMVVDWASIVLQVYQALPETVSSKDFQQALIDACKSSPTWEHQRMAGKLYAALLHKEIHGKHIPTVRSCHSSLIAAGLMKDLGYNDVEYMEVERMINHRLNFKAPHYKLHQIRFKYALRDKITGTEYETAQFVYMRMAMALASTSPKERRLADVKAFYTLFATEKLNPPTPNFTNLGTHLKGYASCCLYTTHDTWKSLLAGDVIAYSMTCMSSGIGSHIRTRSLGDPIRNGLIEHQGKLPYYRSLVGAIGANLQNGRGGAATVHYTAYDPDIQTLLKLRNVRTPAKRQVLGCHYSFGSNKFFARKVAKDEEIALFSCYHAPELYEAQYSKDQDLFEKLYNEFLASDKPRTMVSARSLVIAAMTEASETGVQYLHFFDTMNQHTPHKDPIYSSNLCQEIMEPTKPFESPAQLYEEWNESHGEIALCNLAGIIVSNIESDEEYKEAAYYALLMIDRTIHQAEYVFPTLGHTARSRLHAGVGVLGLAHLMAKKNLKYSSQEGKNFIHELFETHAWHLINASLRLGKELGNAPWIHKTKWPEGWLPIDTYSKAVDSVVTVDNKRDWESLRAAIIENGGIRNSSLIAHMPGESSTIAAATTNSVYPVRDFDLLKGNESLNVHYVVPDSTKLRDNYEIAYDIPINDLVDNYAIMQKWTDQGLSADVYQDVAGAVTIGTTELIERYLRMVKFGLKSRYYTVSKTSKSKGIADDSQLEEAESTDALLEDDGDPCPSGVCTL